MDSLQVYRFPRLLTHSCSSPALTSFLPALVLTDNGYKADEHIKGPVSYDGVGTITGTHPTFGGATALGVQNMAEKVVQGRGVLFDVKKHFGLGTKIGWKELKEIIEKDKIEDRKGDFELNHFGTGQMIMDMKGPMTDEAWATINSGLDGQDPELLKWITESGVVALVADTVG